MSKVRSARGDVVDFELLAIKQQLANMPVPKKVEERKIIIQQKNKPSVSDQTDLSTESDTKEIETQKINQTLPKRK